MTADSGSYDQATLIRRQKIAEAMLGDAIKPQKIEHWAQGLAQLGRAGIGGYMGHQANEEAKALEAQQTADLYRAAGLAPPGGAVASALSGGGQAPAAAPPVSPSPPPAVPSSAGKIYSENESSPLDPPSGADRTKMIATILGEAGNQGPRGQNAVASVIRNRAVNGGYGGDTPSAVVTAPNQFEPWNTAGGRAKMASAAAAPAQAAAADRAIAMAYGEGGQAPNDPTAGAKNFISPKVQVALGRPMPKWAQGPGQDIGDHRFFGGVQDPTQQPYQVAGPAVAAPQTPVAQAMTPPQMPASGMFANVPKDQLPGILQGLTSKNPTLKAIAVQQLGNYTKADAPTDETKEYKLAVSQGYKGTFFDFKTDLKKAGATKVSVDASQKAENKFGEKAAGLQAERFDKIAQGGNDAKSLISDIQSLRDIGSRITTGKTAEMTAALGPYAEALGIKIDGLDDLQAYKAITSRLAPQMRVPGSGATSDFEMRTFLEGLPGLGKTPGGNELISKTLEAMAQHKIAAAEIASKAINEEISRKEADRMLRELPDPLALWKKTRGEIKPAGAAPKSTSTATEGQTATNPQTGEKLVLKGGQWVPMQ